MAKITYDLKANRFLISELKEYYEILDAMRIDLEKDNSPNYLNVSYILFCAATLEYSLNLTFAWKCKLLFHERVYDKIAKSFVELDVKSKLIMAPVILSNNEFMFNEDHFIINSMNELISTRNKILHKKNYFESPIYDKQGAFKINATFQKLTEKKKCLQYGQSLKILKKSFFDPINIGKSCKIVESEFLKKIKK